MIYMITTPLDHLITLNLFIGKTALTPRITTDLEGTDKIRP
jgi:hypothetical protein